MTINQVKAHTRIEIAINDTQPLDANKVKSWIKTTPYGKEPWVFTVRPFTGGVDVYLSLSSPALQKKGIGVVGEGISAKNWSTLQSKITQSAKAVIKRGEQLLMDAEYLAEAYRQLVTKAKSTPIK